MKCNGKRKLNARKQQGIEQFEHDHVTVFEVALSPRGNRSRLRIPDLSRRIIEDLDARNKDEPKLSPS